MIDAKKPQHETREAWLTAAIDLLRPKFDIAGSPLPKHVRVSVGFPVGNAKAIGQCWFENASADKLRHVFISPSLHEVATKMGVLATLLHELAHTALPFKTGHKAPFKKLVRLLGLEGKPTATVAGKELLPELADMAKVLGTYPHGALHRLQRDKEQKNRHKKIVCSAGCDYHLRGSESMLDTGIPNCPLCNADMCREEDLGILEEDNMPPAS